MALYIPPIRSIDARPINFVVNAAHEQARGLRAWYPLIGDLPNADDFSLGTKFDLGAPGAGLTGQGDRGNPKFCNVVRGTGLTNDKYQGTISEELIGGQTCTLTCWVRMYQAGDLGDYVLGFSGPNSQNHFSIRSAIPSGVEFRASRNGANAGTIEAPTVGYDWDDLVWHHLAAVFDVNFTEIWLDAGHRGINTTATTAPTATMDRVALFGRAYSSTNTLDAEATEFRFYDRALSIEEIDDHYGAGRFALHYEIGRWRLFDFGAVTQTLNATAATATWDAPAPQLNATQPATAATATWDAPAATLNVTLLATAAAATWDAPAGQINGSINATAATATWDAPAPQLNVSLVATAATATWDAPAPQLNVSLVATAATATWDAPAPQLNTTLVATAATATWDAPAATLNVTLLATAAAATWDAPAATLDAGVTASFVASRTSGPAPLAVHFEATATTATGVTQPFHELLYVWDFKDTGSGNWPAFTDDTLPKNAHYGPIAVHMFEAPGTYDVLLTVTDPATDSTDTHQVSITVDDPDVTYSGTSTIAVTTTTGDHVGAPAGASLVTYDDYQTALATEITGSTLRVLFRAGETFAMASQYNEGTAITDIQIGSFGAGAKPIINVTHALPGHQLGGGAGTMARWVWYDLEFQGNGNSGACVDDSGGATGRMEHMVMFRCDYGNFGNGLMSFDSVVSETLANMHAYCGLIECNKTFAGTISGWNFNAWGFGNFILGCDFNNSGAGGHVIRIGCLNHGLVAYNRLRNSANGVHCMKIHAPNFATQGVWAEKFLISYNYVAQAQIPSGSTPVQIRATTPATDNQKCRDWIFERNYYENKTGGEAQRIGTFGGIRGTIRNNTALIQDRDAGGGVYRGFSLVSFSDAIPATEQCADMVVANNTVHCDQTDLNLTWCDISSASDNALLINNFAHKPTGTVDVVDGGVGTVETTNIETNADPHFVAPAPASLLDHRIETASPARNAGTTTVYAPLDYLGTTRPQQAVFDCGAFEFGTGATLNATAATATWDAPAATLNVNLVASAATATWDAPAGQINATQPATAATATWDAPAPTLLTGVTLNATAATATWDAPAAQLNVSLVATAATATWDAPAATLNVSLVATAATATWDAPAPTLLTAGAPQTLNATAATATWDAPAGQINASINATAATATWDAPAPTLQTGNILVATAATATWDAPSAQLNITILATAASATWSAPAATITGTGQFVEGFQADWIVPSGGTTFEVTID